MKNKTFLLLVIIVLFGAYFRFYNLNWDKGFLFHPDEQNIINRSVNIHAGDLNPHNFVYGGFTIYLYRGLGEIIRLATNDNSWVTDFGKVTLIGRYVSAIVSSFSIFLVFFLSKIVFGDNKTALLSSAFAAFTVSLIQNAHFATTENSLIFWLLIIYIISFKIIYNRESQKYCELLGAVSGLAIATKITSVSFLLIPFAVNFLVFPLKRLVKLKNCLLKNSDYAINFIKNIKIKDIYKFLKTQVYFVRFLFFTFVFFFLFSPFSILDYTNFAKSTNFEINVAKGNHEVFYTYQFIGTKPYLFYIDNLSYAQGYLLKAVSILGVAYSMFIIFFKRNYKLLFLLIWPIIYFLTIGKWHTKFIRYITLLLPFLAILSAKFLIDLQNKHKMIGRFLIFITLIFTFLYSAAFLSIYKKESTRITASKWMYENIPPNTKILTEYSDYYLPISFENKRSSIFDIEVLNIYDSDNKQKVEYYADKLSQGEYIVLASRRLYGTLINLPEKYPITSRYYKLLFDGELGYEITKEFSSYPTIFGFEINDDKAEETFQVFDHPKILIFKKVKNMEIDDYKNKLEKI